MEYNKLYIQTIIRTLEEKIKEQQKIVLKTNNQDEKELLYKYQKLLLSKYIELEKNILNEINRWNMHIIIKKCKKTIFFHKNTCQTKKNII